METTLDPILTIASSALLFLLWCTAFHFLLPARFSPWVMRLVALLGTAVFLSFSLLPLLTPLRFLAGIVLLAALVWLGYEGRAAYKLLVTGLVVFTMPLAEILSLTLLPPNWLETGVPFRVQATAYAFYLFSNCVLLAVVVLFLRALRARHGETAVSRVSPLLAAFPISQYIVFALWFIPSNLDSLSRNAAFLLLAFAASLAADIILAYAFARFARSAQLRMQNRLLETQIAAQKEYYAALTAHYADVRKMRHDIDNHIFGIKSLLAENRYSDAAAYTEALAAQRHGEALLEGCRNAAAASFLLHRQKELEEKGIALRCRALLPEETGIEDIDLISALGNLLDNAAEASAGAERAEITLEAAFRSPYLSVCVSNPAPAEKAEKSRRVPELARGMGQTILRQLAEKYDGEFTTAVEDGRYTARLLLKMEKSA